MKKQYYFLQIAVVMSFFFLAHNIFAQTKIDVWDFGAEQLDGNQYNNMLDVTTINSWYSSTITPGSVSTSNVFPSSFGPVGGLSWKGGSNDRLRSTNESLTRYDENLGGVSKFVGRLYQNSAGVEPPSRYLTFELAEDDEVSLVTRADATGNMNFVNAETGQNDSFEIGSTLVTLNFVAKTSGSYRIYASSGKPSFYRIYRKSAEYVTLSGTVDVSQLDVIPTGYTINFTNEAGKTWSAAPDASNNFKIQVPAGFNYTPSLGNANGYIITSNETLTVDGNTTFNTAILKVSLFTLSGKVTGLSAEEIANMSLVFIPTESRPYKPITEFNYSTGEYTVQLEANQEYSISAKNINDYYLTNNTINLVSDETRDLTFAAKLTHKVSLITSGLDAAQLADLQVTFNNLNEPGYLYSFTDLSNINLRDGVYSISCSGLDQYPIQLGLTSNLKVNGADTEKNLTFVPVTIWSFDDSAITSSTTVYKGILFSGAPYNEQGKGHLVLKNSDTAKIPVSPGQKIIISYYYSARFTVDGGDEVSTSSGSTNQLESQEFIYDGTSSGFMTIANIPGTTTYISEVRIEKVVPYKKVITVGFDKDYLSINEALAAVRSMNRDVNDTVKIMIDPGNYEEMLVIDVPDVALINAASNPDISLLNKGVDISPNAVRITSYYGHGYNYFSMGKDQKWNAEVLRVNKENGYTEYKNTGSGTGNNSYWNATVLVTAPRFYAENIIFENSFNQYISKKESEDVVVEWASGGKGKRPTDYGNTSVQNKSFVERAAAIAYTKSGDKSVLFNCRVIGRQDSFFGAEGARVVAYKGSLMGSTDYIFGGMTLTAYKSELAMNTSEASSDVAYITAAQQNTSRGFLFYECIITSALPDTETASVYLSKPGYFGRPWQPNTSEAVFYNTIINTTDNPNYSGKSLIIPKGWNNSLGGTSDKVYEFGTIEKSGVDNQANRVTWSKILASPSLDDGTEITTFNFTKGNDNWDPIPSLILKDIASGVNEKSSSNLNIYVVNDDLHISNLVSETTVEIYSVDGKLILSNRISENSMFKIDNGFWIVKASDNQGYKVRKIIVH